MPLLDRTLYANFYVNYPSDLDQILMNTAENMDPTRLSELASNLDTAEASIAHSELIRSKVFLRNIYLEHYNFFKYELGRLANEPVVELGSGGGFIKDILPNAITSDVIPLPTTELAFSGLDLPFASGSLGGITMINVLHHIQHVDGFFQEAERCLMPGGAIVMVEPSNTLWSRFIYKNFHHEPFIPEQQGWDLPPGGRMSSANDALPWIIFRRDLAHFEQRYPNLRVELVEETMPIRYLLSGGVSKRQLVPSWSFGAFTALEKLVSPLDSLIGMFMRIKVRKVFESQ